MLFLRSWFLMYRVELKVPLMGMDWMGWKTVPNVPCGVESIWWDYSIIIWIMFLMYRVELKGKNCRFWTVVGVGS
jgi:hypothetical protein